MPKIERKEDIRIEVYPEDWRHQSRPFRLTNENKDMDADIQRHLIGECHELISQIEKHVDGVKYARLSFSCQGYCEYCGSPWTEDNDICNGGCCAEDVKNMALVFIKEG